MWKEHNTEASLPQNEGTDVGEGAENVTQW